MTAITAAALTGTQKSAVLCIALGPAGAARLLRDLPAEQVEQVARAIAAMPTVEADVVRAVVREFESASSGPPAPRGGMPYAAAVLEEALGERAAPLVQRLRHGGTHDGMTALRRTAPDVLAGLLRGELPQTVAMVASHLPADQASALVRALDPEVAAEVVYRMARMEPVAPDTVRLVEQHLSGQTDVTLVQELAPAGGPSAAAGVLNRIGGTRHRDLLVLIQERDATTADLITARMFVFEDLLLSDGKTIQRVLREIDTKLLAMALKAASGELVRHIKASMSERAASALDEEIELLGTVRVKEVEAAHAKILQTARALEEAGEIVLRRRGGSDDVIA